MQESERGTAVGCLLCYYLQKELSKLKLRFAGFLQGDPRLVSFRGAMKGFGAGRVATATCRQKQY
jgi:hypothetical protein